jgi:PAS domain S-box-containing protein/putative nucleotidyltransferase with HDIG domain
MSFKTEEQISSELDLLLYQVSQADDVLLEPAKPCTVLRNKPGRPHQGSKIIQEENTAEMARLNKQLQAEIAKRKRMELVLMRRLKLEKTISAISSRFIGLSDITAGIVASLRDIARLSGADSAYLYMLGRDNTEMNVMHEWHADDMFCDNKSHAAFLAGLLPYCMTRLHKEEIIHIPDISSVTQRTGVEKTLFHEHNMHSILILPLHIDGHIVGLVCFYNVSRTGQWGNEDLLALRVLAEIIETAIARKNAEDALCDSEYKYRTVFENTGTVSMIVEKDSTISLVNSEFEKFSGWSKEEVEGKKRWTEFATDESVEKFKNYWRMRNCTNENLPYNYEYQFYNRWGDCKDIFVTVDRIPGTSRTVASLLDITERKKAEQELKETAERYRNGLEGTIQAMSTIVETRDPYTAGHQRRVAHLACAIAREMGFAEEQISGIRMAGIIHDIGKIRIPAEILTYPDILSEAEFKIIKLHPVVGYDILKTIDFPWPVARIVQQHHERLNGSGYPFGLSGDDIIEEAKILAVADVVEAMASHRPYRPSLGISKALEEISKNRGILYDADAVDACLTLFNKKAFKLQ